MDRKKRTARIIFRHVPRICWLLVIPILALKTGMLHSTNVEKPVDVTGIAQDEMDQPGATGKKSEMTKVTDVKIFVRQNLGLPVSPYLSGVVFAGPSGRIFSDLYPPAPGSPKFEELVRDVGITLIRLHPNPCSMMASYFLDTEKSVEAVKLNRKWYANSLVRDYHPDKWPSLDRIVELAGNVGAEVLMQINSGTLWDEEEKRVRYFWDQPGSDKLAVAPDEAMKKSIAVMAQEAARVVRYANTEKGYAIKYWEIGNEDYFHMHPQIYRYIVEVFAEEMRKVDPSIVLLATSLQEAYGPGVHKRLLPENIVYEDWELAMSQFSPLVDFLSGHMYWGPGDPDGSPLTPELLAQQILSNAGWADGAVKGESDLAPTAVTEYNMAPYGKNRFAFTHAHALYMASALNGFVRDSVHLATYHCISGGRWSLLWNIWDRTKTQSIQPSEDERIIWRMTPAACAMKLFNQHRGTHLAKYGRIGNSNYVVMYDDDHLYMIYVNGQPETVRVRLDCRGVFSLGDSGSLSVLSGKLFFEDEYRSLCPEGENMWNDETIDSVLANYPEELIEEPIEPRTPDAFEFALPRWTVGYVEFDAPQEGLD